MQNLPTIQPTSISLKDVSIYVESKSLFSSKKPVRTDIVRNINLNVPAGSLVAIMTTLLSAMAGRSPAKIDGQIQMNGRNATDYIQSGATAYVEQQDQLLPYLTVWQTLMYAARLQLPSTMSTSEIKQHVDGIIMELGLTECADTIIGDAWRKGLADPPRIGSISGGEKRRVSVAVQLLSNPSVIFLDEPTTGKIQYHPYIGTYLGRVIGRFDLPLPQLTTQSQSFPTNAGLDSVTSHNLISTLSHLGARGRTSIVTIHQPSANIFKLFDSLILLSRGDLIYSGPTRDVLRYFESVGYTVPEGQNPSDCIVDVCSVDYRDPEREEETKRRVEELVGAWRQRTRENDAGSVPDQRGGVVHPELRKKRSATFWTQTLVLTHRTTVNLFKDRLVWLGSLAEVLIIGLCLGYIFWQQPDTPAGILGKTNGLYIVSTVYNYLSLIFMVFILSKEIQVFDRERKDGLYGVLPYILGWLAAKTWLYLLLSVLYSVITYSMIGLRTDNLGLHLGHFMAGNAITTFTSFGIAYLCIAIARDFPTASMTGNTLFTFLSMGAGFFININDLPVYIRWIKDASYFSYAFRLISTNEFSGHKYDCDAPQCDGSFTLASLSFEENDYRKSYIGLGASLGAVWVIAVALLAFLPAPSVKQAPKPKPKKKAAKSDQVEMSEICTDEASITVLPPLTSPMTVHIHSLTLTIKTRHLQLGYVKETDQPILSDLTATFPTGHLSVIIGASGAGKSTLLAELMSRTPTLSTMSLFSRRGTITYNGLTLPPRDVKKYCSLVPQSDAWLLPGLTARQTLRFAAELRLRGMEKERQWARADEVLCALGLKDAADTVVGSEVVKGLSGGEKRRLSIGVQMLTDPSVLIVDEPTSGLDAFTSRNVMLLLKDLAATGRTVICSIHQPRSDIVDLFDRVLLLACGGRPLYSGPLTSMLPHFSALGYACDHNTNPANFVLDLSSIDFRTKEAEKSTKERVDGFVEAWKQSPLAVSELPDASCSDNIVEDVAPPRNTGYLRTLMALPVVLRRSALHLAKQPALAISRIMQLLSLGIIYVLFFAMMPKGQSGVQTRIGLLQQITSVVFIGMLNNISVFPLETEAFKYEFLDGLYNVDAFFFSYTVLEIPFVLGETNVDEVPPLPLKPEIISAILFTIFVAFVTQLQTGFGHLVVWFYIVFCMVNSGESIGMIFSTLAPSLGFTVQIMSAVLTLLSLMAGFMSVGLPAFVNAINYASVMRYAAHAASLNEFRGLDLVCDAPGGVCPYSRGEDVLQLLGMQDDGIGTMLVALGIATVVYRSIAWVVLKWLDSRPFK
ncbi:hypothetical protein HK104_002846 [Borealophlyctis nickersoniae]|nr:hypothetical protein HK104_002846 [Borealophlyctis nickersoniae]